MKKNVGILGGTFNPIHNGHIQLARKTLEQFELSEILIIPSANPPHKKDLNILDSFHRSEMIKLAIRNEDGMTFSDIEINRPGMTYTADTLTELSSKYSRIYFIIGADTLFLIEQWYHPEITMKLATLVVAGRDSMTDAEIEDRIDYLHKKYGADIKVLKNFDSPLSSSEIRNNIANGLSIKGMVPEAVEDYIYKNGLYRN